MPRKDTRRQVVFTDSGERLGHVVTEARRGGKKPTQQTGGYWGRLYVDNIWRMRELVGVERRVLDCVMEMSAPDQPTWIPRRVISAHLGIAGPSISQAMRNLKNLGIVIEFSDRRLLVDPRLYWIGSDPERERHLSQLSRDGQLTDLTTVKGYPKP